MEDQGAAVGLVNTAVIERSMAAGFSFSRRAGSGCKILLLYAGLRLKRIDC